MEQEIIQPIDKEVLKRELTPELQLRMTNKSHNEIYVITAHNAPNVMKEIGRLREIAFREAGGGTGKAMDIDEFDTCENCYKQLIVWNPEGGQPGIWTRMDSPNWPRVTCSTSQRSSSRSICPIPLNWVVHSYRYLIRVPVWGQKVFLHLIIFGMVWVL